MLCWILIVGGLLIMIGQHDRSEALFYYFRLEDQVPETHLLRLIEKHISFAFVREKLKGSYSETGRPSIDPELLLRILLIVYLYGITSERKLVEELRMHLAWRWFTGLGCPLRRDSLSVTCFENQFLYPPVQQLAHIEFIVRRTCNFVDPAELLELFAGFAQHSQNSTIEA